MKESYVEKGIKLIPYVYKTVTLDTVSAGKILGILMQADIGKQVVTILLPDDQKEIPFDEILSVECFNMETLYFTAAEPVQTPAEQPVQPAVPAAAPAPVSAPVSEEKNPGKELAELLAAGDLSAALALASMPEAMQRQGYTAEETAKIVAVLRADKLPTEATSAAAAQRLWRVVGNRGGLAMQYVRKDLPGSLKLGFTIGEAEQDWDVLAELGERYPAEACADISMLRTYAYALLQSKKEAELLALAEKNPIVLHQKTLYPALAELAQRSSVDRPELAALVAKAAPYVEAYPDKNNRTLLENILLGEYDEESLRLYRSSNCVEMLCKQGYTREQAVSIAERMSRVNKDAYDMERGSRLAYVQGNCHYLSEYYLWEELLTSPKSAAFRLSVQLLNGAEGEEKRDAEYIQLYRACIAANLETLDGNMRYTVLYLGALLRTGQNAEALTVAEKCCRSCTDADILAQVIALAEQTDKERYTGLVALCRKQMKNHKANEFEQMLLAMDRRVMDFANRPEQLEQLGYDKATVKMICTNLPKVNNYPSGNLPYQQYERVYYVQGNANGLAEQRLNKALARETDPQRKKQMNAILFAMLCKEQRLEDARAYLPEDADMMPEMYKPASLWYFRVLYAVGDYKKYCDLYNVCRKLPQAAICNRFTIGFRGICETAGAQAAAGYEIDTMPLLLDVLRKPSSVLNQTSTKSTILEKTVNSVALKNMLMIFSQAGDTPQVAQILAALAEEAFRVNSARIRDAVSVLIPQGESYIPKAMADALRQAGNEGQQAVDLLTLVGAAQADAMTMEQAAERFFAVLDAAFLSENREPICDAVNTWGMMLWPQLDALQLHAQKNHLANYLWLYVHQQLLKDNSPNAAVGWLYNTELTVPVPASYPQKDLHSLARWAMENRSGQRDVLLQKYPELKDFGLQEETQEAAAEEPAPLPATENAAPVVSLFTENPAETAAPTPAAEPTKAEAPSPAEPPVQTPCPTPVPETPVQETEAQPDQEDPDAQYAALQELIAQAKRADNQADAALYLQTLCRSSCLSAADTLTRGSLVDTAAKDPPMLYWMLQTADRDPRGIAAFLKKWRAVAAQYIRTDFSEDVSELMLQLDQNADIAKEDQDALLWAVLTNSSRKNAAWNILQRIPTEGRRRALMFWCAAIDGAQTWTIALRLFWQTQEYLLFLYGMAHRFREPLELVERLQYSDHLQEMCDGNLFAALDQQQLLLALQELYPAIAQSYLATESWTIVQRIRYVSFCVGGNALSLYYDVFAEQYKIITEKLPLEGCAFLAQLGADPKTHALMNFLSGKMLPALRDPSNEDTYAQVRLPSLLRAVYSDRMAEPCRCTEQEEQDIYGLIMPDGTNWSWRHYGAYYCEKVIASEDGEWQARRTLRRFAVNSLKPDAFLIEIEFLALRSKASKEEYSNVLLLLDHLLRLKAEDPDINRALYLEYAILWLQRCPGSRIMDGQDLADWFVFSASGKNTDNRWVRTCRQEYKDLLQNVPLLHAALSTGDWQPCFDLLLAGGAEAEKLRLAMVGAISSAVASFALWHRCTVWQSLPHALLRTMAKNLCEGTPERNEALQNIFESFPALPDMRPFKELFAYYKSYLSQAEETNLRWVEHCAALPLEEMQIFACVMEHYADGCSEEQAAFRSRTLEQMATNTACTEQRSKFLHVKRTKRSSACARAMNTYNRFLSSLSSVDLYNAISAGVQATDVDAGDLAKWKAEYAKNGFSKKYFSATAASAQNRLLYNWVVLLTEPQNNEKHLHSMPPETFVNLVSYLFSRSDRTAEFPQNFYAKLLPAQITATQAIAAMLMDPPTRFGQYMEQLRSYKNGMSYIVAIEEVLRNSLCHSGNDPRASWDQTLCILANTQKLAFSHDATPNLVRYIRMPADNSRLMQTIRYRISQMLNTCTEDMVFADAATFCTKEQNAAQPIPAPVKKEIPPVQEEDDEEPLSEEESLQRAEQCRKHVAQYFAIESESAAFLQNSKTEKNLSVICLTGASMLADSTNASAGSIVRCLLDAAKYNVPSLMLDAFAETLIRAVRLTPYSELPALREQLQENHVFEELRKFTGAANQPEEKRKEEKQLRNARYYHASLEFLQKYLNPKPPENPRWASYDAEGKRLLQEEKLCSDLSRTPADRDPHELLRSLASLQKAKVDAQPRMRVHLDASSAYYCTRPEDDYGYDDLCEPTTLQGYVENIGSSPLHPVTITLSYRIKTGDIPWDATHLPAPRRLALHSAEGDAVLFSRQQYPDEDQKALWHIPFQIDTDLPEEIVREITAQNAQVTAVVEVAALVHDVDERLYFRSSMPMQFLPEEAQTRITGVLRSKDAFFGRRRELTKLQDLYCGNPDRIPMLYLVSGQYRMGKTMIIKKLRKMILDKTNGQVIPLLLEVGSASDNVAASSSNLKEIFSTHIWDQVEGYFQDNTLPPEYRDKESFDRFLAHRQKWVAFFAEQAKQVQPIQQPIQYLPNAGANDETDSEDTASLDISALSSGFMQSVAQEDLRWLPRLCKELCDALGNRHVVYILDEADRLVHDLESVGGAAASNLRALLQSDTPFHLVLCGANGLTEYYLRGGSMTQLFECTYGRPMIIGQMAKNEWREATSALVDSIGLEEDFRTQDQLWFYTRGLIHPAYCLMEACFSYLDNSSSVQPAPNGKTTLYAARMLETANAILCSSPQQLHMDKLTDNLSDDYDDLWRPVLTCLVRECNVPYQWVPVSVLESIIDEPSGITWDRVSNVLSNLVSYRGLLEYSPQRKSYRPQCELYRQILRNKLLNTKLQPYPYFKPRKEDR